MRNVPHPEWKWSSLRTLRASGTWVPTTAFFIQAHFMECSHEDNVSRAGNAGRERQRCRRADRDRPQD